MLKVSPPRGLAALGSSDLLYEVNDYAQTYHTWRLIGLSQWHLPDSNQHSSGQASTTLVGFEPAIAASERPQKNHELERSAIWS